MDDADYKNATEKFQNAFSIKNIDSTKILIDKCISLDKNKGKYDLHNDSADYFIKSKEYVLAMKQYNKAINETHYNDDDILKKKKMPELKKTSLIQKPVILFCKPYIIKDLVTIRDLVI